ncbi:MAG: ABC transporter permease [Candidatus Omnitrophica bacterium]|nr:ABC transporter permease [Candidatus Omnitrophota bacterium]
MRDILLQTGRRFIAFLQYLGGLTSLSLLTLIWLFAAPFKWKYVIQQMKKIGYDSMPIVFLVALFTGIVLALQSAYQMQKISAEMYIASLVSLSMTRELGPVLTALVVAGRVGAAITAELGTMKVTEQIDALEAMAAPPVQHLVVPRFLASIFMLPLLTIYADAIGIFGGYLVGVYKLNLSSSIYINMSFDPLVMKDLMTGLYKTFFFAAIIALVGCFEGFQTEGGAEGVGLATTRSVVISFILIIATDCLFTVLFYFIF